MRHSGVEQLRYAPFHSLHINRFSHPTSPHPKQPANLRPFPPHSPQTESSTSGGDNNSGNNPNDQSILSGGGGGGAAEGRVGFQSKFENCMGMSHFEALQLLSQGLSAHLHQQLLQLSPEQVGVGKRGWNFVCVCVWCGWVCRGNGGGVSWGLCDCSMNIYLFH